VVYATSHARAFDEAGRLYLFGTRCADHRSTCSALGVRDATGWTAYSAAIASGKVVIAAGQTVDVFGL
jgi:hypothetical protein